ncbi:hypothetical protein PYW08_008424 [Mythimna loreyi]|uniref:Uncharacterized protein n=1 Tax=Mythimna loreyi TaxID=667449 RepID=A0ACC2QDW8_9NEOP|nr:hypothetical protein PYW08_008424 [Mythimna loreyi]
METSYFLDKLKEYGVGRRKLDDILFINDKPPPRLGVYDFDEENLCHEVIKSTCNIPGCDFTSDSLLEYENHYNTSHRYTCARCKKILPSPHLLDLHVQENHDSFFAVLSERKPSYCCYIEECKLKFMTANERRQHCIDVHKLPKEFRFDIKPKKNKKKNKASSDENATSMEVENEGTSDGKNNLVLSTSRHKTFAKYSGKKFTKNDGNKNTKDVNMDEVMADLKESLPE